MQTFLDVWIFCMLLISGFFYAVYIFRQIFKNTCYSPYTCALIRERNMATSLLQITKSATTKILNRFHPSHDDYLPCTNEQFEKIRGDLKYFYFCGEPSPTENARRLFKHRHLQRMTQHWTKVFSYVTWTTPGTDSGVVISPLKPTKVTFSLWFCTTRETAFAI